jgi:pSer/pThr/pTyr-binding forkhead associated (FHA) protein
MSSEDSERFAGFRDALQQELADAVREHAREEGYHFAGPVEVTIEDDASLRRGDLHIGATIVAGAHGAPGTVVLPDGRRIELSDEPAVIGRMPDCAIALSDPQVSRHHAEIRRDERGYRVVDLDSTNGIQVNGTQTRDHVLSDGDVILVGATSIRYEES